MCKTCFHKIILLKMERKCDNCNDTTILYTLPCRHHLCENCITPYNRISVGCSRCGARCKKENVIEYVEESFSDSEDYNEFDELE